MGGALHRAWKLSADSTGEGGEAGTDPSAGVGSMCTCSHQARLYPQHPSSSCTAAVKPAADTPKTAWQGYQLTTESIGGSWALHKIR